MGRLIIVCGLPGSGKTTLAEALSKKLGIVCLHKDSIKENLYALMRMQTLEDSKKVGRYSSALLLRLAEEQVSRGVNVIIESPFNFPEDYPLFSSWMERYGVKVYSVICSVDKKMREERFFGRDRDVSHHADGINFADTYDYKEIPGKQIRLETVSSVDDLVENVVAAIG
jgi:predicted kinase